MGDAKSPSRSHSASLILMAPSRTYRSLINLVTVTYSSHDTFDLVTLIITPVISLIIQFLINSVQHKASCLDQETKRPGHDYVNQLLIQH
jgi:hypothetical protein